MKIFLLHYTLHSYIFVGRLSIVSFIECEDECENVITLRSVLSTMIFSVDMKRSTSVLGWDSPSGAWKHQHIDGGNRDCFDPETEWGSVIKTWGMKTCSGLKPASLNRFDVETNLGNQSFTAQEPGRVRNDLFEEQYELLERIPHFVENINQLFG